VKRPLALVGYRANGRDLILADGRRLFMGSSGTGALIDGRDIVEKSFPKK
jgi:hypothetical protein